MILTDTARLSVTQIDLRLTPNPEAVTAARHSLDRLEGGLPPEKLEDVRLIVSELVTNSARHAGLSPDEQISLAVVIADGSVRGRVCDPGPGFEKPSEPRPRTDLSGGWGLPIVERISDRWGSSATATRACGSRSTEASFSLVLTAVSSLEVPRLLNTFAPNPCVYP